MKGINLRAFIIFPPIVVVNPLRILPKNPSPLNTFLTAPPTFLNTLKASAIFSPTPTKNLLIFDSLKNSKNFVTGLRASSNILPNLLSLKTLKISLTISKLLIRPFNLNGNLVKNIPTGPK